jgi:cell division protein FtsB
MEPRPKMMMLMTILLTLLLIVVGYECIYETSGVNQVEREEKKERILRGKGDGSTLHIHIWRQHKETDQTLFEREEEAEGK